MRHGHFDAAAHEYVIDRVDLPASWVNYLGVENWCSVVNQQAGGYSFCESSQFGRVTRFRPNAVPWDRPGHWLYLRDQDDGDYWSCSWQPVGKPLGDGQPGSGTAWHRTRHGLSYSVFESRYDGIEASQRIFVPLGEDAELWDVTVANRTDRTRRISLFGYVEFSFHSVQIDQENFQMSLYAAGADWVDSVIEYDFFYEPWTYHFFTSDRPADGFDTSRDEFIGPWRSETDPVAVARGRTSGSTGTTGNRCGALRHDLTLEPGQSVRLTYLLGRGDRRQGTRLRARYADPTAVDDALAELAQHWRAKLDVLQVATPSPALDTLLNCWTPYQVETCVVWSRFASFVEVGGRTGLGYRDTAQDVMAAVSTNPAQVRRRLLELWQGQMSAGYGLHLFDPRLLTGQGRRQAPAGVKLPTVVPTRADQLVHGLDDACSDDHLWPVVSTVAYVKETGDLDFLRRPAPFADGDLTDRQVERLGVAGFDRRPASLYEHMRRAVDFTAAHLGPHGLAQGLRADWNDCLNLGGGETALVSFLLVWAARALAEAATALGRTADAERYAELARSTARRIEPVLWDGDWYLRGYTADQVKIGSADNDEGRVFLEHMPWAVIAQVAPPERAARAMDAVWTHLASPYGAHLVWPAFTRVDDSVGFITRVYPGVKENAAIFCHPNAWPIMAEAMLGRGQRALAYYEAMAPANFNDAVEVRQGEPYVYCQFIYGRDHAQFGRAQNPWLTGTAGWMLTAASQHILGLRPDFDSLVVDPCIDPAWDGFDVGRLWRGARYDISVRNPNHVSAGVARVRLDGRPLPLSGDPTVARPVARLPLAQPGSRLRVEIELG
ncbi:MAG: hypothetical protein LBJ44_09580 [Propionibacteriaceae bacterium]|jgi:N,N'-diacetylchitobiose phosphorylase|nr:hypothetical protein [Propionibacteriaceae bacterium]